MAQDNDEFWMYDELKTRVADPQALRNKFVNGSATMRDKDSDKMIASRRAQASTPVLCSPLSSLCIEAAMAMQHPSSKEGKWAPGLIQLYCMSPHIVRSDYLAFSEECQQMLV